MNILDQNVKALMNNPAFMSVFAAGKSSEETKFGMRRLREQFRGLQYAKLAAHNPELYGGLYQRADSVEEINKNERFIKNALKKRALEARADADEGLIFSRQLERIDPRRFEVKYKPLGRWRDVLPQVNVEPGLERITYRVEDNTGEVEPATVGRTDTVYVGASTEEYSNKVVAKTLGYKYTVQELHRAAFAGVPLQDRYQRAVLRGYEKNLDITMFNGDALEDLEGLFNHTGVTNNQAAAPGSGTDKTWAGTDKTNDEKIADIRGMVTTIATQSQENYNADKTKFILLLPRVPYDALNVRMAAGTDTTVLEFILSQTKYGIADIQVIPNLSGIGTGSTDLAFMMPIMDNEVAEAHVGDAILWQPMQFHGLDIRFPSIQYHGGVVFRYPIAATQLYGV
jgi:hypothetical protein